MPNFHRNDGAGLKSQGKLRVLLVSIVPPKNDCGVCIVMHRQLVEHDNAHAEVVFARHNANE